LAQQRLDEPLGLAVRARGVGAREALGEAVGARRGRHQLGAVAIAVVTEDPPGDDAAPRNQVSARPMKATTVGARSSGKTSA